MLLAFISWLSFSILILIGYVLSFMTKQAFILVPIYFFLAYLLRFVYRENNCKSIEIIDFIMTGIYVILLMLIYLQFNGVSKWYSIYYLLLITFVAIAMYANSVRFKSLL